MRFDFFTVWFLISPFIILRLWQKNRDTRDSIEDLLEHINNTWDNDYKLLIKLYGTTDNFIECHQKDFDIIRSNIVNIYDELGALKQNHTSKLTLLLNKVIDYDTDKTKMAIEMITKTFDTDLTALLNKINQFLLSEEDAHREEKLMADILKKIDDKYKDNNLYSDYDFKEE